MVLSSLRFSSEKQGHKPGGARASPARARFFQYKIADPTRQIANFPRASARQKKSRLRRALIRARLLGCRVLFCLRDGGVRNWTSLCRNLSYQKFGGAKNQESAPREHQEPRAKETTAPVPSAVRPARSAEPHRSDFPNKPSNPHCPSCLCFFSTKWLFLAAWPENLARERANPPPLASRAPARTQDQRPTRRR